MRCMVIDFKPYEPCWCNNYILTNIIVHIRKPEDLADPQTKLTPHQIHDVQRSWENIRSGRNAIVSAIFVK